MSNLIFNIAIKEGVEVKEGDDIVQKVVEHLQTENASLKRRVIELEQQLGLAQPKYRKPTKEEQRDCSRRHSILGN